jgi:hypothetical protein
MLLLLPFAGLGTSMHSRSAFSRCAQPPLDCELEPQQSARKLVSRKMVLDGAFRTQHRGHRPQTRVRFGFVGVSYPQSGDGLETDGLDSC